MKKSLIITLITVILLLTVSCCETFEYDKAAAIEQTQQMVSFANNSDYQAIYDLLSENVKNQLTVETLHDAWSPMIASAGSFKEFDKDTTQGVIQDGYRYIIVTQTCQYEESVLSYTITFTEDMRIAALLLN